MNNAQDTATHSPKELLAELQALVAEAETMIADSVTAHSSDAVSNLRERFSAAQDRLSDIYEGTKKQVVAGAQCTDTAIRENPYQAVAIALGVGTLIGVLIGRRSK
jgi:ElaB/YqjD/DUF883 family membrane-anchored ribosome-binding protein